MKKIGTFRQGKRWKSGLNELFQEKNQKSTNAHETIFFWKFYNRHNLYFRRAGWQL